ncbi:hypothetical protein BU14_2776s0001 [Porphyra umbilicalis]|uniref:Uncharacterized protein n=1 Tax=Porphyra umbilicalis TaxID=2786 RepID=A0A1X6NJD2_PORUM|nr:hypothetical protein BU14_2776s0001 [Porphyra umbilicalis]|eukprot:OSX68453.1 hypothetical protein BU14_2776s0001 [Porphyra umbilicalis]
MDLWMTTLYLCFALVATHVVTYFGPMFAALYVLPPPNLKARYGTEWALVTGGSSGIGAALCRRLLDAGINVVIAALDDEALAGTAADLRARHPARTVRTVGVDLTDLSGKSYMDAITAATADVPLGLVFANAGWLSMGYLADAAGDGAAANVAVNALSGLRLAQLLLRRCRDERRRGALVFTSSAAHFLPSPFAATYGASKAAVSQLASSLAVEGADAGVDVLVVHPSYTRTNLYAGAPALGVLALLERFGASPDAVAAATLRCVGRLASVDLGAYAWGTRLVSRLIDGGTMTMLIVPFRALAAPGGGGGGGGGGGKPVAAR